MTDTQEIPEDVREMAQKIAPCFGLRAADRYCRHTADDACEDNCEWAASIQRAIMADRAARSAQPGVVGPSVEIKGLEALVDDEWQSLIEKDDRTSPAEYPDMALISKAELGEAIERVASPDIGQAFMALCEEIGIPATALAYLEYRRIALLAAPDHTALLREAMTALDGVLSWYGGPTAHPEEWSECMLAAREVIQSIKTAIGDANG